MCLITSNLTRAKAPGNVLLRKGEDNLPKASVVNVSQIVTIEKAALEDYVGILNNTTINGVLRGLHLLFERT